MDGLMDGIRLINARKDLNKLGDWRRGRDSNPRSPARRTTVFETAPFDRSGTSPHKRRQALITGLRANETRNWHPIGTRQVRGRRAASIARAAAASVLLKACAYTVSVIAGEP